MEFTPSSELTQRGELVEIDLSKVKLRDVDGKYIAVKYHGKDFGMVQWPTLVPEDCVNEHRQQSLRNSLRVTILHHIKLQLVETVVIGPLKEELLLAVEHDFKEAGTRDV